MRTGKRPGRRLAWTPAASAAAAVLGAVALVAAIQPPSPHEPGFSEDFAHLAEGYTSEFGGGPIEAGYRMFSVPDFTEICTHARSADVRSLRAAAPPRIEARVGEPLEYSTLHVDALDAVGVLVPRVPIAVEVDRWSDVFDTRSDHIAGTAVTPAESGSVKLRVRTLCDGPGGETLLTIAVAR